MEDDGLPCVGSVVLDNMYRSQTLFGRTPWPPTHAKVAANNDIVHEEEQQTAHTRNVILRYVGEVEMYVASLLDRRDHMFTFHLGGEVVGELDVAIAKGCLDLAASNADAALRLLACGDWATATLLMGRARSLVQATGSRAAVASDAKMDDFVKAMVSTSIVDDTERPTKPRYRGRVEMLQTSCADNEVVVSATPAAVRVSSDAYRHTVTEKKRHDYLYGCTGDPYGLGRALCLYPERIQMFYHHVIQLITAVNAHLELTSNTGTYLGGRTAMERALLPPGMDNPRRNRGAPLSPHPPSVVRRRTASNNSDVDERDANNDEQRSGHAVTDVEATFHPQRVATGAPSVDGTASPMRVYLPPHRLRVPTRPVATEAGPPRGMCVHGHGRKGSATLQQSDDGNDSELEACGVVVKVRSHASRKPVRQVLHSPTRASRLRTEAMQPSFSVEAPKSPAVKSSLTKRHKRRTTTSTASDGTSRSVADSQSFCSSAQHDESFNDSETSPLASPFLLPQSSPVVIHEVLGRRSAEPSTSDQPLPLDDAAYSSSTSMISAATVVTSLNVGESFESNNQQVGSILGSGRAVQQKSVPLVSKDSQNGAFPVFEGKLATLEAPGAKSRRAKLPSRRRAVAKRRSILMSPELTEREKKRIVLKTVLTIQRWFRRTNWWVNTRDHLVSLRFERRRGRILLCRCFLGFASRVHLATTFRKDRAIIRLQYAYRRYRAEKKLLSLQRARDAYLFERERQDGLMDRIVYLMRCCFHGKKALEARVRARDADVEHRIDAEKDNVDQILACETQFHHTLQHRIANLNRNILSGIAVADPNLFHAPSLRAVEEQRQRHAIIVEMQTADRLAIAEERWWAQRIIAKYFRRYQCRAELERRRAESMFALLLRSHDAVKTDMITPALVEQGRWGTTVYTALRDYATSVTPQPLQTTSGLSHA